LKPSVFITYIKYVYEQNYAEAVFTKFKKWYSTSSLLNIMLFIEIYFFVFIVEGKTLIALTLCFSKVFFRVLAMQIVSYSIRDFSTRAFNAFNSINPVSVNVLSDGRNNSQSSQCRRGTEGPPVSPPVSQGQAPPYEDLAPPSYEEAIKSCKVDIDMPKPDN
jgi:hypothetical protein